jgi:hypothetical protein
MPSAFPKQNNKSIVSQNNGFFFFQLYSNSKIKAVKVKEDLTGKVAKTKKRLRSEASKGD